jgi:DNA-binding LytR/AlgR family response regulator
MDKMKYFIVSNLAHDQKENVFVRVVEVCYFKSIPNTNYLKIGFKNGNEITTIRSNTNGTDVSFTNLIEVLPDNFYRSGKDSIVNLDLITEMRNYLSNSFIAYYGDREVVFSRRQSVEFRKQYRLNNQIPFITIPENE